MSYQKMNMHKTSAQDAAKRLAEIANCAWLGYSKYDLKWRYRYYDQLFPRISAAQRSFRIIEYVNQVTNSSEDCAFVVILPLAARIAEKHLQGELSQYSFSNTDLEPRIPRAGRTYHYFQSFYRNPEHRESDALRFLFYRDIAELLKRQGCGREGYPFTLYAETSFPKGREIAIRHGLAPSHLHSFEKHPFFVLDSQTGDAAAIAKLRQACAR